MKVYRVVTDGGAVFVVRHKFWRWVSNNNKQVIEVGFLRWLVTVGYRWGWATRAIDRRIVSRKLRRVNKRVGAKDSMRVTDSLTKLIATDALARMASNGNSDAARLLSESPRWAR